MNNLTLGQYFTSDSPIHRLDPRTKLIALIPLIIILTVRRELFVLFGFLGFFLLLLALSRVPVAHFFRQLTFFLLIIGLTFILHSFIASGTVLFTIPVVGFDVTSEGVSIGFYFGFRLFIAISFSVLFMLTTAPMELTDGLEKMLRPLKKMGLNIDSYALMLGITLRFIPVLLEEGNRISKAQIARGAQLEGKLFARIHALSSVVIPLFISVFKRADTLAHALEVRGFPGSNARTYYKELRFRRRDITAFIVVFGISAGAFVL